MKRTLIFTIAAMLLIFTAQACKKEPVAKKASVVFWQTQSTANTNTAAGSTTYFFYVAGNYLTSRSASEYWNTVPDCDNVNAARYSEDITSEKSVVVTVKDQDGDIIYNFAATLKPGVCLQQELQ